MRMLTILFILLLFHSFVSGALGQAARSAPQRVVIPFDFESRFDDGRYGQMVGDLVWKKLQREGGFIIPESMQEVRDWCQRHRLNPGPDTPLDTMRNAVRKEQAGDIGIWGKVERVEGNATDVYDIWITVADFSVEPPKTLYTKKARTKTVSEIPHIYVKEAMDILHGRDPAAVVAEAPRRPAIGPNLMRGDFEKGRQGPEGWDPLPRNVTWVNDPKEKSDNHILRFQFNEDVAGSTGVLFYSQPFPVEAGATYRFRCRFRTSGSAVKVFVKCYDELPTRFQVKGGGSADASAERREVYRSQQNLKGEVGVWTEHEEEFTPHHAQFTPRSGRVMLYGYWPAGTVEWDDVVVEQVTPAPATTGKAPARPTPSPSSPAQVKASAKRR